MAEKNTEKEHLLSQIHAMKETINRDWADITHLPLSHDERVALRTHIEQCVGDLKKLTDRLDALASQPK